MISAESAADLQAAWISPPRLRHRPELASPTPCSLDFGPRKLVRINWLPPGTRCGRRRSRAHSQLQNGPEPEILRGLPQRSCHL
jgi:hypothetical protein